MLQLVGDKLQLMPTDVVTVIPSYSVQCEGFVSQWSVVLSGEDQTTFDINFLVWRPSGDSNSLTLVGQNLFSVEYKSGQSVYVLQPQTSDRINVNVGDVIGVYTFYTEDITMQYGIRLMNTQDSIKILHKQGLETFSNETTQVSFSQMEQSTLSPLPMIIAQIGK